MRIQGVLFTTIMALANALGPGLLSDGWSMRGGDAGLSYDASKFSTKPSCHPNCKTWKKRLITTAPATGWNSTFNEELVAGGYMDYNNQLVKLDSYNGSVVAAANMIYSYWVPYITPLLMNDGSILVVGLTRLSSFRPNMTIRWHRMQPNNFYDDDTELQNFVTIDPVSGDILVSLELGPEVLQRVDFETGETIWSFNRTEGEGEFGLEVPVGVTEANEGVAVLRNDGALIGVNTSTGERAWTTVLAGSILSVIVKGERVFAGGFNFVAAVRLDNGMVLWESKEGGSVLSATSSFVYAGRNGWKAAQLSELRADDGVTTWSVDSGLGIFMEPLTAFSDAVCGTPQIGNFLRCFDRRAGKVMKTITFDKFGSESPVPLKDGRVAISFGWNIRVIDIHSFESPPPFFPLVAILAAVAVVVAIILGIAIWFWLHSCKTLTEEERSARALRNESEAEDNVDIEIAVEKEE